MRADHATFIFRNRLRVQAPCLALVLCGTLIRGDGVCIGLFCDVAQIARLVTWQCGPTTVGMLPGSLRLW